ncbi:MAG: TatD family hydrolase [Thermoleophilia bacterium]
MHHLVDCHAHLDLLPDPAAALSEARLAGVDSILAVGIDLESSRRATAFAKEDSQVHAAVGIHPHSAAGVSHDDLAALAGLAGQPGVVAIGETGLDYYRDRAPRPAQADLFRRHIQLAGERGLPLVVHSRDSTDATLELLEAEAADITIILHCFAMVDQVAECARRGYYMSIAGNVSYKNADSLRKAVRQIPEQLLLTESDAPYLAPVPHRGKANTPAFVIHTIEYMASLRGTTVADLSPEILANYRRVFDL